MPNQELLIKTYPRSFPSSPFPALDVWSYWLDAWQRGVLFLDVLQQRSKQYEEHAAKPPRTFSSSASSSLWTGASFRVP